ncbi:MAG: hypothetical protein CSH37_04935 [Thalassolituus sp.]|jgi:hypothetical protein|uniref:Lipoprotein n=1 Tax=Thalassolituus maritimus TaxID=484498 RepID=A0ABQ0A1Z7_9GAMM|nr:hypothetical protein [Pseudomonadota bacterium]MEC8102273.1 hypothetical protein [Pseudomonadota bacterium]MEC8524303.1 hypothetical protein [Pseudomonadota bacterium]MEE2748706.1 hypothetical protein [Pseudomonadota bacterium]TNC86293.1 MAG: hypothetical protein CSH37_04935 [Thalassolituus sp.]|tara:strand:+ start:246 stop:638 length:393 start_codon:yes stop_codon:yes gene_type:complete
MSALRFLPLLFILTAGCTPLSYQAVNLDGPDSELQTSGYIDKEVSEGVHVIEVRYEYRAAFVFQHEKTLSELKSVWHQRANALCSKGYQGEPEVIRPDEARTDEFYCTLNVCQKYPVVSGIAYCKATYEL